MKIGVAGGGPAGLYFALLTARSDASHQITVVERNPPDATYGWGVVFSAGTLGELREADRPSYLAIFDRLVGWDAIDVVQGGTTTRARGQGFSAISRRALLEVLHQRCRELGVELLFSEEVDSADRFPDADVVVAADGINSRLRESYAPFFRPRRRVHPTKYVWYGTDMTFHAFTFIFQETEHGLFQVHAYPFDSHTSTFIVETTDATWLRSGLDRMDEVESMAFCQDLFSTQLRGHKLMSNRSTWMSFVTLRTATWHHHNLVLLGDAAHTAHFSIGSGTKLAMEDAFSLHNALTEHPDDLAAAFATYELERQPAVDRFQEAADESAAYFESVGRYLHFHPLRFTFNLLTRSGRVTHLALEQRDPSLVAAVDRQHATEALGGEIAGLVPNRPLATPLRLNDLVLTNRVAMVQQVGDDSVEGMPGDSCLAELSKTAASGAGLTITEHVAVAADGRITGGSPGIWHDDHAARWVEIVRSLRTAGPRNVCLLLSHAGPRASTRPRRQGIDRPLPDGWRPVAASPRPYTKGGLPPKEATSEDLDRVLAAFAYAAERAAAIGFDMLMIDLAGGYFLGGFISPLSNQRQDGMGGDVAARISYPLEVVRAVAATWPAEKPLAARIVATDWHPKGTSIEEAVGLAVELKEVGVSLVEVTGGGATANACPDYRRLYLLAHADQIRNQAHITTIARGGITTFDLVDTVVAAGRADLCILDRWLYR